MATANDTPAHDTSGMINIRNLSIKCGCCGTYQTLSHYARREEWNVYTYECDNDVCDRDVTRTYLEVPEELDGFARRDPGWHGGKRHAGGGHADEHADQVELQVVEYDPFTESES